MFSLILVLFVESESYDPLSLVSVGLDDEEDDYEDDLTTETDLSATCSFCQAFRIYKILRNLRDLSTSFLDRIQIFTKIKNTTLVYKLDLQI